MDVEEDTSRRKFIRVATIGASAACGIFPIAAGIPSVLDPVKKSAESGGSVAWSKVAPIASLPRMVLLQNLRSSRRKLWMLGLLTKMFQSVPFILPEKEMKWWHLT